jgi:predicted AlkP superfamily phosphohydrolase/phosphomutase
MSRALVIGLDGMPLSLTRRLAADGVLPCLGGLLTEGTTAELVAPVPEVSSTSWATFLTGVNPGRHGIYGFTDLRPGSYEVYFPNLADLRAAPLWEHAEAAGLTTLSLNVPGTYPAPPISGGIISGFVAPLVERAVQPPRLAAAMRRLGYQIEAEVGDVASDPGAFVGRLRQALAARVRLYGHLLATEPWDLAVAVVTETDRLQHFLWRQLTDPSEELNGPIIDFYREVDDAVAALLDCCAGTPTDVYIISDHGFGPADCQFHVNAWLRAQGWLAPLDAAPKLAAIDGSTQVFALDPGRFYINSEERFASGQATAAQASELAAEIAEALRALRWRDGAVGPEVDGPPAMSEVYRRDDIYHGPITDQAPDVVAVPAAGVQLRGAWQSAGLTGTDVRTGTHTRGDALAWASQAGLAPAGQVDMADIAPTVLGGLGAARAGRFDGRDLTRAALVASTPIASIDWRK